MNLRFALALSVAGSGVLVLVSLVACEKPAEVPVLPVSSSFASSTTLGTSSPSSNASAPVPTASAPMVAPPSAVPSTESPPTAQVAAKEGEMCGGIAGIACAKGLTCANLMKVPDGSGTCRKSIK